MDKMGVYVSDYTNEDLRRLEARAITNLLEVDVKERSKLNKMFLFIRSLRIKARLAARRKAKKYG